MKWATVDTISEKRLLISVILCILGFVCLAGLHRFYVGKTGTGILMLLTAGGCGIWTLIDLIVLLSGNFKDADNLKIDVW